MLVDNLTSLRTASSSEEWGLVICFTDWSGRLKRLNEKTWGVAGIEQTMHCRSSNLSFGVCLVERPLREEPCWAEGRHVGGGLTDLKSSHPSL